ncbi:thiolase C-terminal domain-containing protein [Microbulbifer hydrolyticus]|uniref:Acetyl-CoA C-acetyltransferase n=1 Tax=Microbulbifer hydrolyticus TaxID=48074 RepID=A0A6P1T867_9GAMM|nr:beta-ketoacyl synthase N-terminal-like domain-containing protein [Microbulbifer hydrolyticus]MBB5210546.1 acetyl-CoA C-acetyltransferase [Microbulbifer hydrolyticus]QHQ38984.1 propanoyl-CoA acyltransferase [Microbulbifer hydrolyticus]
MSQPIYIAGGAHTKFAAHIAKAPGSGEREDRYSIEQMLLHVTGSALADAKVGAAEIDGIWVGSCSPGAFANQELLAPLTLEAEPDLRFTAVQQCTAACASSTAALHAAADALQSGRVNAALVIGIEKMNLLGTAAVTEILGRCSYWPEEGGHGLTFPGLFAQLGENYRNHHGIASERYRQMLAAVAAANYRRGIHNPLAHFGPGSLPDKLQLTSAAAILDLPAESNPEIAAPLHLHDCSPISDGAAALVLVRGDSGLNGAGSRVELAGRAISTDQLALSRREKNYALDGARDAVSKAYREAGISAADLDLAEVHDCFTSNQLLCLEALGLSDAGRAGEEYLAGGFGDDARCQINLSGGLKSKGHPVGATGVSMHYFAYRQLLGRAVGAAHPGNPQTAAVLNIGGSGVVNCTSILRAV